MCGAFLVFESFIDIAAHLKGQIPFQKRFWGCEQAFSNQTYEKIKLTYFQNYCIDCN